MDNYYTPINKYIFSIATYDLFGKINKLTNGDRENIENAIQILKDLNWQETLNDASTAKAQEKGVLCGYYRDLTHLNWIMTNHKYNTRIEYEETLNNTPFEVHYLLLHNNKYGYKTFAVSPSTPTIASKEELAPLGDYSPHHDCYLLYSLGEEIEMKRKTEIHQKLFSSTEQHNPFIIKLQDLW